LLFYGAFPLVSDDMTSTDATAEVGGASSEDEAEETGSQTPRKITFPVESILNAVIQDGDVIELFSILCHKLSEININQRNHSGLTALHYAVLTNNLDSVKLLINYGAEVSVQDIYGFSPLHTAAALGYLHVSALLIVYGADVFSLTNHSELPIDLAKDISVIRLLSTEMCLRLHREEHFKSLAVYCLKRTCSVSYQCAVLICRAVIVLLQQAILCGSHLMGPYVSRCVHTFIKRRRRSIETDADNEHGRSAAVGSMGKVDATQQHNRRAIGLSNDIHTALRERSTRKPSTTDLELPNETCESHISLKRE